jgi:adenine-specific DNA-methyltransferase
LIKKIEANEQDARSADIIDGNLMQLKKLFPEVFTEGGIDFAILKQVLGGEVDEQEEKYGLIWFGKRQARQIALTPSTGTLRPCPEESLDWDTTQNLMIEGDNLEVLKLLQKSYAGKVKMIYIDPPYNTGNDFVYTDDFKDNLKNYQIQVKLRDENGERISSQASKNNTISSGRFHTDWLNMMYPRLKLARNLLKPSGLLFISINNGEAGNLRKLCDEIFGEENFLQQLVWKQHAGGGNDARHFASDHEYIMVYCRNIEELGRLRLPLSEADKKEYSLTDKNFDALGPYKTKDFRRMRPDDPRPGLTYPIEAPDGTKITDTWKWEQSKFLQALADEKVQIRKSQNGNWIVEYKIYLYSDDEENGDREERTKVPRSILDVERNAEGKRQLRELFGIDNVFSNPKPKGLISYLISFGADEDSIILDFFAGSGTTGHAVLDLNVSDNGKRRYILVQLDEPLDPEIRKEEKIASELCDKIGKPRNLAEITKERLRRASQEIKKKNPLFSGDRGFRSFQLDSSNIREWEAKSENLPKSLEDAIHHLKSDRSEMDILYELLLKLGLDLCVPINEKEIAGKKVHSIGGGVLIACLSKEIRNEEIEPLSTGIITWLKELNPAGDVTCIFQDSGFENDVVKTNFAAIFEQNGIKNLKTI